MVTGPAGAFHPRPVTPDGRSLAALGTTAARSQLFPLLVPYDPTPIDASDTLDVQLQGAGSEPETVLRLSRPRGGVVRVAEFPALGAPAAYDAPVADVLARVERAARERRRVGVELYALRRWLGA